MRNAPWITTHAVHPLTVVIRVKHGVRLEFAAEKQVTFNKVGDVIISRKSPKTLHQYQLEGCIYKEVRSENLPPGVDTASIVAVYYCYGHYELLLQDKNTATKLIWSPDSRELLNIRDYEGIFLPNCNHTGCQMFAVERTEREYEIVIKEWNDSEIRLQLLTAKATWSHPYLSVCRTDYKVAVTSAADRSLDIYRSKLIQHTFATLLLSIATRNGTSKKKQIKRRTLQ